VQSPFRHTEEEYLAAARLYFWQSKALLVRLVILCALISICLLLVTMLLDFALPIWFIYRRGRERQMALPQKSGARLGHSQYRIQQ
jgi:hypothetical protein